MRIKLVGMGELLTNTQILTSLMLKAKLLISIASLETNNVLMCLVNRTHYSTHIHYEFNSTSTSDGKALATFKLQLVFQKAKRNNFL